MPSFVTHSFFCDDVIERINIDPKIRKKIEEFKNDLRVFSQSSDPFLAYNLVTLGFGKNIRSSYQKNMHNNKTKEYLIEIIKYIKENKLEKDYQIISMLYGYISHYVLDSVVHPYIIYKTGIFTANKKNTYKYNGLHAEMEVFIDCYMIYNREKILPKDYKIYEIYDKNFKLRDNTINLLDTISKNVYGYNNFSIKYLKAIRNMSTLNKYYRYDKSGIKKVFYELIDLILSKKYLKKKQLSYNTNFKRQLHYLNIERKYWNHPMDVNEIYNSSLIELYKTALNKCIDIINNVNLVLFDNYDINILNDYIKDISLKTGKDCSDKRQLKYFEF